jgi:predicted transcriptional regulator
MSVSSVTGKPLSAITITEIMNTRIAPVHMDDRLDEASNILLNNKISCLPVANNKILFGIITWQNILKAYCHFKDKS